MSKVFDIPVEEVSNGNDGSTLAGSKEAAAIAGSRIGALFKGDGSTLKTRVGGLLGLGAAAGFAYSAGDDIFGEKEKDAAGQEVDRSFWKPALKLGAAAAAVWATLAHGGKVIAARTV